LTLSKAYGNPQKAMIVKNPKDPEVIRSTHIFPKGIPIRILLAENILRGLEYVAYAVLMPGQEIEEHLDPVEEVYFICRGQGIMQVEEEEKGVKEKDVIWVPANTSHSLKNPFREKLEVLIIGAYPRRR